MHVSGDSSEPSGHSGLPSHTHLLAMHFPSLHWNSFLLHESSAATPAAARSRAMTQRRIRSAVLILSFCVASSLGSQTPKCSRCKHWIAGPTVSRLRIWARKPHGVPAANYAARPESFPVLGARFPGGGGVCNGVIFKNLHLTERGGAWNGRCDIVSFNP